MSSAKRKYCSELQNKILDNMLDQKTYNIPSIFNDKVESQKFYSAISNYSQVQNSKDKMVEITNATKNNSNNTSPFKSEILKDSFKQSNITDMLNYVQQTYGYNTDLLLENYVKSDSSDPI